MARHDKALKRPAVIEQGRARDARWSSQCADAVFGEHSDSSRSRPAALNRAGPINCATKMVTQLHEQSRNARVVGDRLYAGLGRINNDWEINYSLSRASVLSGVGANKYLLLLKGKIMKHFITVAIMPALTACGEKEQTVVFPEPAGSIKQAASPDSREPSASDAAQVSGTSGSSDASASQAEFGKTGSAGSSGLSGSSDASGGGMYTVKQGDSLAGIARELKVNYQDLARWNNIKDPNFIYASQQLRLNKP